MGQLHDIKPRIEQKIEADGLDTQEVQGKIGPHSAKLLAFISESTPDDPVAIAKLKQAAKEVLNLSL